MYFEDACLFNKEPGAYRKYHLRWCSGDEQVARGYHGRYLPSGHLVYMHRGTLFAVRMDFRPPHPYGAAGAAARRRGINFRFFQSGVFVYDSGRLKSQATMHWLEQSGKLQPLLGTPSAYMELRFSPDGKRLALVRP